MPVDVVAGHRALLKGRALDAAGKGYVVPAQHPSLVSVAVEAAHYPSREACGELLLAFGPLPEGAGLVRGVKDVVSNDWEGDAANSGTSVTTDCRKMQVAMP